VKFVTEADHKYSNIFCMKYCLQVNKYRRGNGAKLYTMNLRWRLYGGNTFFTKLQ
jgi:hypothetical protein